MLKIDNFGILNIKKNMECVHVYVYNYKQNAQNIGIKIISHR